MSFPLQPSVTLPASMRTAVVGEGSARQPTAFDEHWIKRMIDADGAVFKGKLLKVIISGTQPTDTSLGLKMDA
ncbi:hypothetical protein BDQ17DRAFT_1436860 [Cyathus striatus]|nr:hypothetical protein BDQ17DRAFT_1436860 [Cyathus striatus]